MATRGAGSSAVGVATPRRRGEQRRGQPPARWEDAFKRALDAKSVRVWRKRWSARAVGRVFAPDSLIWLTLLLVAPIVTVGFALSAGWKLQGAPFIDYDYWWHLAMGNLILDHHRVPTSDPFSWTYAGKNWVVDEWLAEVILALLVRAGGYAAVISFTTVVVVAGYWWLIWGARCYGLSLRAAVIVSVLWAGVFLRSGALVARPQVWGWALLAIFVGEIAAYDTGRRRTLWALPPLVALWVNLHLSVFFGLVCLGAFVLDRLLRRKLDRRLLTVGVLCVLALLVNPRGWDLLYWKAEAYLHPSAIRYTVIWEWQSPKWHDATQRAFWRAAPVGAFAGVVLAFQLIRQRRIRVWPALPVVVFLAQSLRSVRFIPFFVIVLILFVGWVMGQLAAWQGGRPSTEPGLPPIRLRLWTGALPAAAVAVALAVILTRDDTQFHRDPNAFGYPVRATAVLMDRYPQARIFNDYNYGGYLIYRFGGTNKVYIDGREDMYGDAFVRRYFGIAWDGTDWQRELDREGVTVAIMRQELALARRMAKDPNWTVAYQDSQSIVFARRP